MVSRDADCGGAGGVLVVARSARDEAAIRRAADALRRGSLIGLPTDTVYGLAADPRVPGAEERICAAKGRDRGKPIPLLASDIGQVRAYGVRFTSSEELLADRFWPGPLTLVLSAGDAREGFRVPDSEVARAVLAQGGGVLRVTSANRSGQLPALTADEALRALGDSVELVLDAGPVPGGTPSTVVRLEGAELSVLREGAIPAEALREVLG